MAEFILNARRAPRAPARCRTAVVSVSASFEAETEDIGARGCQVVSPKGVKAGVPVRVTIANDKLPDALRVGGRIAWVSAHFPWRVGIAFDESALPLTTSWFEQLVAAHPGMRTLRRLPERISTGAMVYLAQPPRFLVDFTADEAALLRAIGSGAAVYELMARFRVRGAAVDHALFSLLARSVVTMVRGQAVHPDLWKRILDQVETSLAVASLGKGPASLRAPPEAPAATGLPLSPRFGTPAQDPSRTFDPWEPASRRDAARPAPEACERPAATPPPVRARNAEAQALFDRGQAEFRRGNVAGAIALLRRALSLAPGDLEIGHVLGKLAFGGGGQER